MNDIYTSTDPSYIEGPSDRERVQDMKDWLKLAVSFVLSCAAAGAVYQWWMA